MSVVEPRAAVTWPPRPRAVVAGVVLALVSFQALSGGGDQMLRATGPLQQVQTAAQLAAGAFGVLVLLSVFELQRWRRPLRLAWATSLVLAAGLSALAWGPPMPGQAVLFAALAALVAAGIMWGLRAPSGPA